MFLVDATPCGLLSGALGFVRPTFSLTQRLASGDCSGQPGGFEGFWLALMWRPCREGRSGSLVEVRPAGPRIPPRCPVSHAAYTAKRYGRAGLSNLATCYLIVHSLLTAMAAGGADLDAPIFSERHYGVIILAGCASRAAKAL